MHIEGLILQTDDFVRFEVAPCGSKFTLDVFNRRERVPVLSILMDTGHLRQLVDILQQADRERMEKAREADGV